MRAKETVGDVARERNAEAVAAGEEAAASWEQAIPATARRRRAACGFCFVGSNGEEE